MPGLHSLCIVWCFGFRHERKVVFETCLRNLYSFKQDWQIDYIALQLSSRPANTGSYLLIELEVFETELRNMTKIED